MGVTDDLAAMDAAMRQALLVARTLVAKKKDLYGIAFKTIEFDESNDSIRSTISDRDEPFDADKFATMLSKALYAAFNKVGHSAMCRGREHADRLATRLLGEAPPPARSSFEN